MFLNTTLRSYVDPFLFPGRFLICVDTDDRKDCGVFSGRHGGFRDPALMEKRQTVVTIDEWSGGGLEVFEIAGLPGPLANESLQYHFGVLSWRNHVYISFMECSELVLCSSHGDPWHFAYRGLDISLDRDYGAV